MMLAPVISHWQKNPLYPAALLGTLCAVIGLLLVAADLKTEPLIAQHLKADQVRLLSQVLPESLYDNDPLAEMQAWNRTDVPLFIANSRLQGQLTGYVVRASVAGWGGNISFIMAVDENFLVRGVRVIEHSETPGLADRIDIEKSRWIDGFNGHSLANLSSEGWAVKKDGGEFDQFTGATITPRAMVNGVHDVLIELEHFAAQIADPNQSKGGDHG